MVVIGIAGVRVCFAVEEIFVGVDANGDGEASDDVLFDPREKLFSGGFFLPFDELESHLRRGVLIVDPEQELVLVLRGSLCGNGAGVVLGDVLAVIEAGADEGDLAAIAGIVVPLQPWRDIVGLDEGDGENPIRGGPGGKV